MIQRLQCLQCKHFLGRSQDGNYQCAAYPERIPDRIVWGDHDHRKYFRGDQGIRFEPKEASSPAPTRPGDGTPGTPS